MATIITGMRYSITTHGAHSTKDTCILGRGEVELDFTVHEPVRDVFVSLATQYALAGLRQDSRVDINTLPLQRRYLLHCDAKKGIARGLYLQSIPKNDYPGVCHFSEVVSRLDYYKSLLPVTDRAGGLVQAFAHSTGLVHLLLNSLNAEELKFDVQGY